jgi:hypothetical protein
MLLLVKILAKKLRYMIPLLIPCMLIAFMSTTNTVNAPSVVLGFNPLVYEATAVGQTFKINVTIANIDNCADWIVRLSWNPAILSCEAHAQGSFLSSIGSTDYDCVINNVLGKVEDWFAALLVPGHASGSGTLGTLTFKSKAVGQTSLTIYFYLFHDEDYNEVTMDEVKNCNITVVPEFPAPIILLLFMISTVAVAVIAKKFYTRKRWSHNQCSTEQSRSSSFSKN